MQEYDWIALRIAGFGIGHLVAVYLGGLLFVAKVGIDHYSSMMATARVQPADAARILTGKQAI